MASLNLKRTPYPTGDTEDDIRKDPILCRTCWNLYGGSTATAVPLAGIAMHENSGSINANRAATAGNLDEAPAWAGRGRIDYASWQISVYLPDIPGTVARGCPSCFLLQEILTKLTKGALDCNDPELWLDIVFCKGNVLRMKLIRGSPPDDFDMFSSGGGSTDGDLLESFEIYTMPGSPCPWPTIGSSMNVERPDWSLPAEIGGHASHIEPDPTSKSSFDRVKSWIKTCKDTHTICTEGEASSNPQLPKRVIDIGPDTNDGIHIFVHDDATQQITEPYIALSHCWGKTQHLISTRATLDQWKQNIPFNRFAKTFQDAVVISRELGIRYVWIDSLCIVQDDKQDWEIEAAKMASIYNGAELVLAATGSADGSGGCLFQREPFVTVSGTFPEGKPFEIYGRKVAKHAVFGWNTDPNGSKGSSNPIVGTTVSEVYDYPLMTRAWCFQERLLATRILHYTKSEMIFDCLSSMECECGALEKHEDDPLVPARRIIKTGHKFITGTKSYRGSSTNPAAPLKGEIKEFIEHHELWRDLIVQYSQKNITKRTDGLPAVAGLATEWFNKLTGRYLAGLWEKDILNDLRWMPDEKDSGEEPEYISPSWSWLSVHRGVTWGVESFEFDKFFVTVDFDRTACPLSGHNQFGAVDSGYIFLTGRIMCMTFSIDGNMVWLEKPGNDTRKPFDRPDSLWRLRNLKNNELFCLRLSTRMSTRNAWDDDAALVLVKADEEILKKQPEEVQKFENVYQRVGFITNYMTQGWNHERDSKEMGLYII
ncbi:het domain-containing protein [Fusarium oxysporum f. sp. phaseoli]